QREDRVRGGREGAHHLPPFRLRSCSASQAALSAPPEGTAPPLADCCSLSMASERASSRNRVYFFSNQHFTTPSPPERRLIWHSQISGWSALGPQFSWSRQSTGGR